MSDDHFPPALRLREQALIEERRRLAGVSDRAPLPGGTATAVAGLALSGGGIRSATLSLGLLQALAEADALRAIDYLSTVSGGGYAGAFLGGLYQPRSTTAPEQGPDRAERVRRELSDERSFPIRWLRDNGRYIAPNGATDLWTGAATVLRNLVAIHVVLATFVFAILLGAQGLRFLIASALIRGGFGEAVGVAVVLLSRRGIWWSPYWCLPVLSFVFGCLPTGIAYWVIRRDFKEDGAVASGFPAWLTIAIGLTLTAVLAITRRPPHDSPGAPGWFESAPFGVAALVLLLTLVTWAAGTGFGRRTNAEARNVMTVWLRHALVITTAGSVFAFIDTAGQTIYATVELKDGLLGLFAAMAGSFGAVAVGASAVIKWLGSLVATSTQPLRVPSAVLAAVGAAIAVTAWLSGVSTVAHAVTWGARAPLGVPESFPWWVLLAALGLALAFGRTYSFLNRSTLATLYAARLTRAYLGASNEARQHAANQSVTRILPGDEIDFRQYAPHLNGGPLHIINVTLNETVGGRSDLEERDRRGMNMAVGPAGVSVAARHHALWDAAGGGRSNRLLGVPSASESGRFAVFPPTEHGFDSEPLDVGQWMAISGAAVSAGAGWQTSLGLSLLTGLFNLRLGRWWSSGVAPRSREQVMRATGSSPLRRERRMARRLFTALFPVEHHLMDELLGRFWGPARRFWYLTDGGHFENTGIYELIRRRAPVIVAFDNGADPDGHFSDFANLVRKARTDFGAEVRLMNRLERERALLTIPDGWRRNVLLGHLGDLEDLGMISAEQPPDATNADGNERYAALAWIEYPAAGEDPSRKTLLVLIKPRVTPRLPIDVREYKLTNPDFPQQPTSDQFFDERQWESHRKLGQQIGRALFPSELGFWPALVATAPPR